MNLSLASDYPTWGGMIADGRTYVNQAPWLMLVVLFTLDGLKDALDPVMRR